MMACDFALAADSAYFTLAYCHIALSPDGGATWALPRLVGLKKATEIALLGERFDTQTALGLGLINRAVPAASLDEVCLVLAARLKALDAVPLLEAQKELALPQGVLTAEAVLRTISALMPENAIIVDESISAGRSFFPVSMGTPAHDYLQLTGGSIGSGLPMATGAAIACPGRTVINMEGDGSSMYTIQALWTQAREKLNVVTVIFANRGYQILKGELVSVGAASWGERAERMLSIVEPDISWVKLAEGMGVEARAATTCEELAQLIRHAVSRPGPFLIEAQIGR